MRLVAGLFALTLMSSLAAAEDSFAPAPPAPGLQPARASVGLRVVRMLPETRQALLFDRDRGTHVLASVGSTIGVYQVDSIDEDAVTLTGPGREIVLAAPDPGWSRRDSDDEPRRRVVAAAPAPTDGSPSSIARAPVDPYGATADVAPDDPYARLDDGPADPYPDPYADPSAPLDPYADTRVRVVDAPIQITPGDGGIRVTSAAAASEAPLVTIEAAAPMGEAAPAPGAPSAPMTVVLRRAEVQAALADFAVLTRAVRGSFTPAGARVETVAMGSVFAKAGLRPGDLVTAVDGVPLRSIDAAAELYVRAPLLQTATVQLVRDGKPLTMRLAIQ